MATLTFSCECKTIALSDIKGHLLFHRPLRQGI